MGNGCYLLSLEEFLEGEGAEKKLADAMEKLDSARRGKAEKICQPSSRASCVGAGLLLQLAVQEGGKTRERGLQEMGVQELLQRLKTPVELVLNYGKKGKPYLAEYPLFFNLSHSGGYVLCAFGDQEIGADIQKCTAADPIRLGERFFAPEEVRALRDLEEGRRRELFFRLWARKEAYGKLLGEGLPGVIGQNLLPGAEEGKPGGALRRDSLPGTGETLLWQEWDRPQGYRIALCRREETAGRKTPEKAFPA